ncbi:hypothetical protein Bhyg_03791 [Pseudolycoriella hygida]|uniref:Uncharacterized protein n=1 Tax=Pseudolycoriella hygida TaxID=35572 RepID=A0A9Q0NF92_9DIPT|nr:hypothetical protein Bhyg_03791 [Pseudolycoriella hygida]
MWMPSSKSMLLRVVLLLEILLLVTANSSERKRFCGQQLTESLQFFCRNRYATPPSINEKRSGDNEDYAYLSDEPLADNSPFSYQSMPFLASFGSATALRSRRAMKGGIYEMLKLMVKL